MNTIFAQMIEDCCYIFFFLAIENGKTMFGIYFALRRFDFNYYGTCINELHYTLWYKRKRKESMWED